MSSRGGRDRPRRDYPLRTEEKSHHGRSSASSSRHLWVGNLSHTLTERALSNQFREFGELESVAFQPGRSYAFINFIDDSAAFAAFEALQGFVLAGNALKIEFTKADKSSASKHDEHYSRPRDEPRSSARGSTFPQRDSRTRHASSDPSYRNESPKPDSKNAEQPSEVLWVGFPQSLKVDEDSLWDAFSPFGEIVKISMFPGRTYAFIRYKHVSSAARAKNNLLGKLFNNPRVHISFAKNDSGPSNSSRNLMNEPPTPRARRHDRYHEPESTRRSPRYLDPDGYNADVAFDRKRDRLTGRNAAFEPPRFQEVGPDIGFPGNIYGRNTPMRDRVGPGFHDFPSQSFRHQGPSYDDDWDLPEDALVYHGAKRPKSNLLPEPELPEYPFSESEQVKHVLPRASEFSRHEMIDNNVRNFGYHKHIPEPHVNIPQQPFVTRGNSGNSSYDTFQTGPVSLAQNPLDWKRLTPEPAIGEWKWEGIIAKGGTSICRARCFPVGKVLDMNLPEFLDCTARTNLDVLAKHFYRAAKSWVVFFVPESDADMGFYNEFMNYLGEKQRAAVAKLDDKTTLFLVPPSDFSEKILKVPGKLSISGVILRLDSSFSSVEDLPPPPPPATLQPERPDPYAEASRTPFAASSGTYSSSGLQQFSNLGPPRTPRTGTGSSLPGLPQGQAPFRNMVEPIVENRQTSTQDQLHHHNHHQNLIPGGRNPPPPSRGGGDYTLPPSNEPASSNNYRPGSPTVMPQYGQQNPLSQLASYLGNSDFRQPTNTISDNVYRMPQAQTQTQTQPSSSMQVGSEHHPASQYRQVQQFQQPQVATVAPASQSGQVNAHEEADADPQKRLQATLELAATLLKQIQQGKN